MAETQSTLSELHELMCDHLATAGLPVKLLAEVRKELLACARKNALNSKLFTVFQYVKTGTMDLAVVSLTGDCTTVRSDRHMSVSSLKKAIALNNGPSEENQCILYGDYELSNDTKLSDHGVTPLEPTLSLVARQRHMVYIFCAEGAHIWDSIAESWSDSWKKLQNWPLTRSVDGAFCNNSMAATAIDSKLFLVGLFHVGAGEDGDSDCEDDAPCQHWSYEPGVNEWSALPPPNVNRWNAAAASFDGRLVVLGGRHEQPGEMVRTFPSVESYDIKRQTWVMLPNMNVARPTFAAIELSGKLYAIGGSNEEEKQGIASVEVYESENDKWVPLSPMYRSRHGHAVAVLDGKLYVVGGERFHLEGSESSGESSEEGSDERCRISGEVYDPALDVWTDFAPLDSSFNQTLVALLSLEGKLWAISSVGSIRIYDRHDATWIEGPDCPGFGNDVLVAAVFKVP